jgi:hypothetical protein
MSPPIPIKPVLPTPPVLPAVPDIKKSLVSLVTAPPEPDSAPLRALVATTPAPLPIAQTSNATFDPVVRTARSILGKRSSIQTVTIPAGATFPMAAYGSQWQLLNAPCPIPVRYDMTAGFSTYVSGLGVVIQSLSDFTQLEFQNPLNYPITITVSFGWDGLEGYVQPNFPAITIEGFFLFSGGSQNFGAQIGSILIVNGVIVNNGASGIALGNVYFRNGFFYGYQAGIFILPPATANANAAYIGRTANLIDQIPKGGWVQYQPPAGQFFNLANFYCKGTSSNDGVWFSLT